MEEERVTVEQELDRSTELKADGALLLLTLCWGLSYYAMDVALSQTSVFALNTMRFLGAFALVAILFYKKLKTVNRTTLLYAALIGITLAIVYIGATFGVKYTTLSKSSFLACTTVFFTPFFEVVFFKKKISRKMWLAIAICVVGIALLTLKDDFSINRHDLKGDLFSLMTGVAYALDLCLTERAVRKEEVDPFNLGSFSLFFCGIIMLALTLFAEETTMPHSVSVWVAVVFLAIFCTGLSFVVQPIAQQYTEASHVGLIFALEPVFAGFAAFFLAHEILTARGYLGQVLMIFALIYMEVDFGKLLKGKRQKTE